MKKQIMTSSVIQLKSFNLFFMAFYCLLQVSCSEDNLIVPSVYKYIKPEYENIQLNQLPDTVSFILSGHTYNTMKSFNIFSANNIEYFSFYDDRSQSICISNFTNRKLIKKIKLKRIFKRKSLYKTTIYTKNFDSIFVNNLTTLYLIDSSGGIKGSTDFLKKPLNAWAIFQNTNPLVIKGGFVYAAVRPYVNETSLNALKKWKVLYGFDLEHKKALLYYHLPKIYQEKLYGYHFLDYNYCYNNRGNFVFSFPADTILYETNLSNFHIAYYAKSKFQINNIEPISEEYLKGGDLGYEQYKLRDSYGPVLFDPFRRRYLRLAKQKNNDLGNSGKQDRKESIIIFDENFRIIGESLKDDDYSFSTLFFTSNGKMYARVNAKDEYALHFVRLEYNENKGLPGELTKIDKTRAK